MKKNTIYLTVLTAIFMVLVAAGYAQKTGKIVLKASIAGISNGDISRELLLSSGVISCSDSRYEIIYFSLSAFIKNGDLIVYNGRGNTLTESMKAILKELEPGCKVVIEDIGARSIDEKIITLPPIELVVN